MNGKLCLNDFKNVHKLTWKYKSILFYTFVKSKGNSFCQVHLKYKIMKMNQAVTPYNT